MSKTQVQVEWEDQKNINRFNKLNNQWHELQAEAKAQQKFAEDLEEASNELMLADEEEQVRYAMSDCLFVHFTQDEVETKLEEEQSKVERDLENTKEEVEKIEGEMDSLKKTLYRKFGNAINLEED